MTLSRRSRSLSRPDSISLDAYADRTLRATWRLSLVCLDQLFVEKEPELELPAVSRQPHARISAPPELFDNDKPLII